MAEFFNDIDELKEFVAVTKGLAIDSIGPNITKAARKFIIPMIGQDIYDEMITAYTGTPNPQQAALIKEIQRSLAPFSVYMYIPEAEVTFNDSGIMRAEGQHQKTAYAKQVQQLRESMIEGGYDALEDLIAFLETNKADYPTWVNSPEYTLNKSHLLNDAKTFSQYYLLKQGRQTYKVLFPTLKDVELFYIIPQIGQDYYDELLDQILNANLTAENKKVLEWIQAAVANFTISEGIKKQWVVFTDRGVVFSEHSTASNYSMIKTGMVDQVSLKIRQADDAGNRYLSRVITYMDDNIDDYPTYRDDETVNPTEEESVDECTSCECSGRCTCAPSGGGNTGGFYTP
jgi:hypothetical protein